MQMTARRTKRQVKADRDANETIRDKQDSMVKSRMSSTYDDDNLFSLYDEDDANEIPESGIMADAFIGRMQGTTTYIRFIDPYVASRGGSYELIHNEIENAYVRFVYNGSWTTSRFFEILLFAIKSMMPINQYTMSQIGLKYDKGLMPMNLLSGVSEKDYNRITNDVLNVKGNE